MVSIHSEHIATPEFAADNARHYYDMAINTQLERKTSMPYYRAIKQRVCTGRTSQNRPVPDDIVQEKVIGHLARANNHGARGGKVATEATFKSARESYENIDEISSTKRRMAKGLDANDKDECKSNIEPGEEQYVGEIETDEREMREHLARDPLLTTEMNKFYVRGAWFALKMFGDDDEKRTDRYGKRIKQNEYVSCIDVRDQLTSSGLAFYQIGENRLLAHVNERVFNNRSHEIPETKEVEEDSQQGRRNMAQREKNQHPNAPLLHNNRFVLSPEGLRINQLKRIFVLQKDQEQQSQLISDRLRSVDAKRMVTARVGNEWMWTKRSIAEEIIAVRNEFNDTESKIWIRNLMVGSFGTNNISDQKIRDAALVSSQTMTPERWANLLKQLHRRYDHSTLLKESVRNNGGVVLTNVWEASIDGAEPVNLLEHPFVNNTLRREESNQYVDFNQILHATAGEQMQGLNGEGGGGDGGGADLGTLIGLAMELEMPDDN